MRKILIMISALGLAACSESSSEPWTCASDGYAYERQNGIWTKVLRHGYGVKCARTPNDVYPNEKTPVMERGAQ